MWRQTVFRFKTLFCFSGVREMANDGKDGAILRLFKGSPYSILYFNLHNLCNQFQRIFFTIKSLALAALIRDQSYRLLYVTIQ